MLTLHMNGVRRKNNELLAQISILNKQLQDSAAENFELRGSMSAYQRSLEQQQSRIAAFERERLTMLDLIDELNRAVCGVSICFALTAAESLVE
jgi:molecular chaperone GrpE (heat shock protein)